MKKILHLRKWLAVCLALTLLLLSGCEDTATPLKSSEPKLQQTEFSVPSDNHLSFNDQFAGIKALSNGNLLYSMNFTDSSTDQASPETQDYRFYVYNIASGETTELGNYHWSIASNDNMVCMKDDKVYFSFDANEYSTLSTEGIKLVEVDLQNKTVTDRVVREASVPMSNLAKLSDTEFIYDVGLGTDIRTYSLYIYNTETRQDRLFLTMEYDPETNLGRITQRARKIGEYIYVLVEIANGEDAPSNVLEKYSTDGELLETIALPQEINPYVYEMDGMTYRISDFDIREDRYYFYSDGNVEDFYYIRKNGEFISASAAYGWGTLYPEADPQYVLYNDLYEESTLYISHLETGETIECRLDIDSEYNVIRQMSIDQSGGTDQIALLCTTENAWEKEPEEAFRVYFIHFSDLLATAEN